MRKWILFLFFVFVFFAAAAGVLFASRDWWIKTAAAAGIKNLTGFDTAIRSIRLDPRNIANVTLDLQGLTLLNPRGFDQRIFADIPEIYVQMNLKALLKKEGIHIPKLAVDLRELNIEKNPKGISNLSLLTSVKKAGKEKAGPAAPEALPFQLDRFELTLRRVRYHDRSSRIPKKLSVDLKVQKQVFEGIGDPHAITNLIVMKVLTATTFGNLGVNLSQIQDQLRSPLKTARAARGKIFEETGIHETYQRTETLGKKVTGLFGKFRPKRSS